MQPGHKDAQNYESCLRALRENLSHANVRTLLQKLVGSAEDSKVANITDKWKKAGNAVDKTLTPVTATPPSPVPATFRPPAQYNPEVGYFGCGSPLTSSATAQGNSPVGLMGGCFAFSDSLNRTGLVLAMLLYLSPIKIIKLRTYVYLCLLLIWLYNTRVFLDFAFRLLPYVAPNAHVRTIRRSIFASSEVTVERTS